MIVHLVSRKNILSVLKIMSSSCVLTTEKEQKKTTDLFYGGTELVRFLSL